MNFSTQLLLIARNALTFTMTNFFHVYVKNLIISAKANPNQLNCKQTIIELKINVQKLIEFARTFKLN